MRRRLVVALLGCFAGLAIGAIGASGQEPSEPVQYADRGPTFFAVPEHGGAHVDARNALVLKRTLALDLDDVSIPDALAAIERQAGVRIVYASVVFAPTPPRVSIQAGKITLLAALTDVLQDAQVDVKVGPSGILTLVPRESLVSTPSRANQGTATITGHVTDGALKTPLSEVSVRVEGTALRTTANTAGKYTITGVLPGIYRVTARRVGYQPLTKEITIIAGGQTATLDFALVAAPTRLDEVVTTAVGEQRRYEVGNDISTINADSIAPTAPITSLTDLISARAPGVTVLETSGMTGSGEAIRIEGLTSLVLQNDPVLIVDGVRQDNSAGGNVAVYFNESHPTPTRLNDIDFSDIATIDILKGPAASTEYGTDAANGVIVITTKHGQAGSPQWRASAEQTESAIPVTFPQMYYSWGHTADGTHTPVNCPLASGVAGTCVVDSVTQENPLNNPATSIFGMGTRGKYDLSVSGGSEAARYYVAGGLTNEVGIIRMPSTFRELADTADLGLPGAALSPNSEQQRSVRANTAIKLGPTADLAVTASYLSTFQQTPNAGDLYLSLFNSPALNDAAHAYGYGSSVYGTTITPLSQLSEVGSQNTDRVTGGLTGNWRPTGWFVGHATVGLDHGSEQDENVDYPLANQAYEFTPPFLGLASTTTDIYSVDVRGTATAELVRGFRSTTSAGVQLVDTRITGQTAAAADITSTNLTLNGATAPTVGQLGMRQATLGGYGEEQLSLSDRLFLTGALRVDAASGFGAAYNVAAYPKASVSWLAVNGSKTTVRLRGAFGESGVQPMNGAALQLYEAQVVYANGGAVSAEGLSWPGDPHLSPERTGEFEGGVDVGGWGNRLSVTLTGYTKTTKDALVNESLGATLSNYTYQQNIGEVRNSGAEASVTATVIDHRSVTWTVGLNASINHNTLVTLGPGVAPQIVNGSPVIYRQAAGYPLYGIWAYPASYADANHDGIIAADEATVGDSLEYVGPSLPTREVSVTTHVGLMGGAVSIGALVDYRGGYRIADVTAYYGNLAGNTLATNDPAAPLSSQARAVAGGPPLSAFNSLDVEDGSYVRFRELSVTYVLPRTALRTLRMGSVSVTGAVRNLALWTRYTGPDPEVSNSGLNIQFQPNTAESQVNNDMRADYGTVPLARYWVVRLNVGL